LQIAIYNKKYSSQFHGNLQIAIYNRKIWNTSDFESGEFKSPDFEKT
jgi:hypothetical protein